MSVDAARTFSLPAMVNAHSHAFQIALRGRAERPAPAAAGQDDFWSWRETMYAVARSLDETGLRRAAERAFAEMRRGGYGAVGEFHYVHHQPDGTPYDDPARTAKLIAEAAVRSGLAVTMLPACYARAGWDGEDLPPTPGQLRFCDRSVDAFLERVTDLRRWADSRPGVHVGVAAHSARAVPFDWLREIAAYADEHGLVRHVHAAEQQGELRQVEAEHGCSPIELLARAGFLGPSTTVVHAIHVDDADVRRLAETGTTVVTCPTTEGSLGDGHFPALRYRDAGVPLAVGSDSQVRIDPFEEVRELETGARREAQTRAALLATRPTLWRDLASAGARSIGIPVQEAGAIQLARDHPSLAGVADADLELAVATCVSSDAVVPSQMGDGM